jgi:hypothetical protein
MNTMRRGAPSRKRLARISDERRMKGLLPSRPCDFHYPPLRSSSLITFQKTLVCLNR